MVSLKKTTGQDLAESCMCGITVQGKQKTQCTDVSEERLDYSSHKGIKV